MRMTRTKFLNVAAVLAICVLTVPVSAKSPKAALVVPLSPNDSPKIVWHGQFGTSPETPNEVFCLMGNNFLKAPVSTNFQTLITYWLAKHPHAKIVRVFNFGPILVDRPNLSQTYVWVVDGRSNLNEYLVQQGGCPGLTMFVPQRRTSPDPRSHFMMEIPEKEYLNFLDQIAAAEQKAQTQKLGIWKPTGALPHPPPGKR
jgi:hypothetical protein